MNRGTIILIQPSIPKPYKVVFLPFGPLFLASKLLKSGYRVLIYDERVAARQELDKMLETRDIIFIGFSIFTGPNISKALEMARHIRSKAPGIKFVWGGPHPTILPEQTAKHQMVDIVVRGEGDLTLPEIAHAMTTGGKFDSIKGITYKKGSKIVSTPDRQFVDWDTDVEMALDLIDIEKYIFTYNGVRTISIITSRGCPFRCSFCWNLLCNKRRWRGWSVKKVQRMIKPFADAGVRRFLLEDDFIGSVERVRQLSEMFKRMDVEWAIENGCRVDVHNSDEFFRMLNESRCTHLSYGAESGSQRFLDLIHKDIRVGQIINSARASAKYNVGTKYSWMVGMPGETVEDVLTTVDVIDEIKRSNPNTSHSISFFSPYPGTALFDKAVSLGWKPPTTLEGWSNFREEMTYPYIDNIWFYKSVLFCNFFIHAINKKTAIWKGTKRAYAPIFGMLYLTSLLRWRMRMFGLPYEFRVMVGAWKMLKNNSFF